MFFISIVVPPLKGVIMTTWRKIQVVLGIIILAALGLMIYDNRSREHSPTREMVRGAPQDYVPFTAGREFHYVITIGEVDPLWAARIDWTLGNGAIAQSVRGRFFPIPQPGRRYDLRLRIVGPAAKQGPYSWDGVEVKVVKDDLGIYEGAERVFWTRTRSGALNVLEVRTYSPGSPGAPAGPWGTLNSAPGASSQIIFFSGTIGARESLTPFEGGDLTSPDSITLTGVENGKIHFTRLVARDQDPDPRSHTLSQRFEEHTWFEPGRGMVRLEQRIDGKVSMIWQRVGSGGPPPPSNSLM
jgi:hypothetical protein